MLKAEDRKGQVIRKIPYKGYIQTQIDYIHLCKDCGKEIYKTKREETHSLGYCDKCARNHRKPTTNKYNELGEKQCNICEKFLPTTNFNIKSDGGLYSACSRCNVLRRFGITPTDYDLIFQQQEGKCAICKQPPRDILKGKLKFLSVDHNHTTGKIRGLLCQRCNQGIGMLNEDPTLFTEAVNYLNNYL